MPRATELVHVCATCVFLRYSYDGSLLLAAAALAVLALADLLARLTAGLCTAPPDAHRSLRALILRALRAIQLLVLVHTAGAWPYRATRGTMTLRFLAAPPTAPAVALAALDIAVTWLLLARVSCALGAECGGRRVVLPQLQVARYGALALLRFDAWAPAVCRDGLDVRVQNGDIDRSYGAVHR